MAWWQNSLQQFCEYTAGSCVSERYKASDFVGFPWRTQVFLPNYLILKVWKKVKINKDF